MQGTEVVFGKEDLLVKKELTSFLIDQGVEFIPDRHKVGNWKAVIKIKELPHPNKQSTTNSPEVVKSTNILPTTQNIGLTNSATPTKSQPSQIQNGGNVKSWTTVKKPKQPILPNKQQPQTKPTSNPIPQTQQIETKKESFPSPPIQPKGSKQSNYKTPPKQQKQQKQQQQNQAQPQQTNSTIVPQSQQPISMNSFALKTPDKRQKSSHQNTPAKPPVYIATASAPNTGTKDVSYSYYIRNENPQRQNPNTRQTDNQRQKSSTTTSESKKPSEESFRLIKEIPKSESFTPIKQKVETKHSDSNENSKRKQPKYKTKLGRLNQSSETPLLETFRPSAQEPPSPRFREQTRSIQDLDQVFKRIMYEQFDKGHSQWFKELQVKPKYQLSPRSFEASYRIILNKLLQDRVELMSTEQLMKYYQYIVRKARSLYIKFLRDRGIQYQSS